uniref:Caspase-8 n=1 Tax=Neolamprologus brichardi TaxID=32507 RepID=A0A3Q4H6M1_NEOBR
MGRTLLDINNELESSEVAALCFLCSDVVSRKHLEEIRQAKELFSRLSEKGLLENNTFLKELLRTIHREDLIIRLEAGSGNLEETDARRVLSNFRIMLYKIYDDMTVDGLASMKLLLKSKLGNRHLDHCKVRTHPHTFKYVTLLHEAVQKPDQQLAIILENYTQSTGSTSIYQNMYSDNYKLTHNPRGWCVVFNNEIFTGTHLKDRKGTQKDADALNAVFTRLGFQVKIHNNCTAEQMKKKINDLGRINFTSDDALVVFVLSHGEKECVFGTDGERVLLKELTDPFTSKRASTLTGKPKLFFIQACQGDGYQKGYRPCSREDENRKKEAWQADDSSPDETVPELADFLIGMATVEECKSFRNTLTGSIYIQELCKQLKIAEMDDILTVLTRVNREISKGEYSTHKPMPEPKYTLTKKLVLKYI